MNINIYVEDNLGKKIKERAELLGKSRNSIIREAIKEWLQHHKANQWPTSVQKFKGVSDFPPFESHRSELTNPAEDPLK